MTPSEDFAQKRLDAESLIRQHAPERLQEQLIGLLRPAIALTATRADDTQIPVGASKFGGAPDVPADFVWPMWNGEPIGFLAQFNLEEVAPFDAEGLLPKSGLLSFFFNWEDWSGTAEDLCRVFWFDSFDFARASSVGKTKNSPSPSVIIFEGYYEIDTPFSPVEGWTQEDINELDELTQLPYGPLAHYGDLPRPESWNKMHGYGDDVYGASKSSFRGAHDHLPWHSLLQLYLPQFPGGKPDFGEAVVLYFSIRPGDLQERHFHKAEFEVGAS